MNILDYINNKKVDSLIFDFDDDTVEIHVKPLSAAGKNDMMNDSDSLMNIHKKSKKAKDDGEDYTMTADEIKKMTVYRQKQAFYTWCDEKGKSFFKSYQDMIETVGASLLEEVCNQLDKALIVDKEDAPKN